MFEVEAKIALHPKELNRLIKYLTTLCESPAKTQCEDTYYEDPKRAYLRIRQRGGNYALDIKRRQTKHGIESNIETSWNIRNIQIWRGQMKKFDLRPSIKKTKKSLCFHLNGLRIELNHIRRLGHYLEIEMLVPKESGVGEAKKEIIAQFKELGFDSQRFEPKPYLELLQNV